MDTPGGSLQEARRALLAGEREEAAERRKLIVLEMEEEQLCLEIRRGMEKAALAPGVMEAAKKRLHDLSRKREEFARQKADQWKVVRGVRERLHAARRTYEELQRHALGLQQIIRREERTVVQWQRRVKETEEQLARWQRILGEAQARLGQAQWELAELAGVPWQPAFASDNPFSPSDPRGFTPAGGVPLQG